MCNESTPLSLKIFVLLCCFTSEPVIVNLIETYCLTLHPSKDCLSQEIIIIFGIIRHHKVEKVLVSNMMARRSNAIADVDGTSTYEVLR